MNNILDFISKFKINSLSELRYVNRKAMNWILAFLILFFFVEGELLQKESLIISGFMLWGCLAGAARYKDNKKIGRMHYIFALLFFLPSIIYAGLWSVLLPIVAYGYLYWKHRERDIHLLVFEVLLFINTQILILI